MILIVFTVKGACDGLSLRATLTGMHPPVHDVKKPTFRTEDRVSAQLSALHRLNGEPMSGRASKLEPRGASDSQWSDPVSYTHLTLPTILLV